MYRKKTQAISKGNLNKHTHTQIDNRIVLTKNIIHELNEIGMNGVFHWFSKFMEISFGAEKMTLPFNLARHMDVHVFSTMFVKRLRMIISYTDMMR